MSTKKKKTSKDGSQVGGGKMAKSLKESAFLRDGNSRASSSNSSSNTDIMRYQQNNETGDLGGFQGMEMNPIRAGPQPGAGNQPELGNNREYSREYIPPGMYQNNFNSSYPNRNSFLARNHDDGSRAMSNGGGYQSMLNAGPGKSGFGNLNNAAGPQSPHPVHMGGGPQRSVVGIGGGFMRPVSSPYGTPPLSSVSPGASVPGRFIDGGPPTIDGRPTHPGFAPPLPTPMLNQLLQYTDDKHHRNYNNSEEDYSSSAGQRMTDEHLRQRLQSNQNRNQYSSGGQTQPSPQANPYAPSPLLPGQPSHLPLNNNNTHTMVSSNSQPNASYNKSSWPPSHVSAVNEEPDSPAPEHLEVPSFQKAPYFTNLAESASPNMAAPSLTKSPAPTTERTAQKKKSSSSAHPKSKAKKKKVPTATLC